MRRIVVVEENDSAGHAFASELRQRLPESVAAIVVATEVATGSILRAQPDLLVLGASLAEQVRGETLLRELRAQRPELPVVVFGVYDAAAPAARALKAGATEYIALGPDTDLVATLAPLLRQPAGAGRAFRPPGRASALANLVGRSSTIERVRHLIRTAAGTGAPVLIEGETGTGKEVVARALHALSPRAGGPFLPVNCAAVPDSLAESEFFGHARGAFTGAVQDRPGALTLADRGTLFLDEIEDMPLGLQAKLLRVVQDREVRPVGSTTTRRVDVRLLTASNRELWRMVEAREFRADLFYRLRVCTIRLPALRERREDIPLLVEHFLTRLNEQYGTAFSAPGASVLQPLLEHPWPGNVRELENMLEACVILATGNACTLAEVIHDHATAGPYLTDERTRIMRVLDAHRWNRQRAAAALGISRVTLWRRMERHGIRDPLPSPTRETA